MIQLPSDNTIAEFWASGRCPLRQADGGYRWFLFRAVPIRDDGRAIARWYGTGTDVTERIRIEDELREAASRKDTVLAWQATNCGIPLTPILTSAHLLTMMGPDDPNLQKAIIPSRVLGVRASGCPHCRNCSRSSIDSSYEHSRRCVTAWIGRW